MKNAVIEKTDTKEKLALSSSLIASILASLCCIAPIVTLALGLGSFGLSSLFEALRPYLLVVTAVLLGTAFYFTYRKSIIICENGMCKTEKVGRFNKVILWIVTGFVVLFAAFPYYSGLFVAKSPQASAITTQSVTSLSKETIKIEGMTCAGCVANVENSLKEQVGVKSVIVSLEPGQAVITYDPSKIRTAQLVEVINNLGYKASL
ncbi:MAG: mercuric transporter MerT family protein [Blastocatellia bacterium]